MSTALFVQPSSPGWFGEISSLLEHRPHLPSTQLDLVAVRDRGVRDVLIRWNEIDWTDAALVQLDDAAASDSALVRRAWARLVRGDATTILVRRAAHFSVSPQEVPASVGANAALGAIDDIAVRFGLPLTRVLKAAGVRRRTFYAWRRHPAATPRVDSVGHLWALGHFVEDLQLLVDDAAGWIRDPFRIDRFERRDFDSLLDEASTEHHRPTRREVAPVHYAAVDAVEPSTTPTHTRAATVRVRRSSRA